MDKPITRANDPSAALLALSEKYPFAACGHIGKSLLGREIPFLRVGTGDKSLVYFAGDSACDLISEQLLLQFADDLCAFIQKDRPFWGICPCYLLQTRSLYILPRINPDGRALSLFGADPGCPLYERQLRRNGMKEDFSAWKGNARGVIPGLNFNLDFVKRRNAHSLHADEGDSMGEFPESEHESAALAGALRTLTPLCLVQVSEGEGQTFTLGASESVCRRLGEKASPDRNFPSLPGAWYHSQYRRPAILFTESSGDKIAYIRLREHFFEIIRLFCAPNATKL